MLINASRCCCHSAFFSAGADSQARFAAFVTLATSGVDWAKVASGASHIVVTDECSTKLARKLGTKLE